ncbi:hypothetical protein AAF712_016566 [Marasmius tenuissimus]|uniref:Uncharacterized protein n=1 Tax=Marasmius tenuissimus TaxID=585030 RepID=A0ABR2Z7I9_9AGAR
MPAPSAFNIIHIVHQSPNCVDLIVSSNNGPITLDPNMASPPLFHLALDKSQLDSMGPITVRLTCLDYNQESGHFPLPTQRQLQSTNFVQLEGSPVPGIPTPPPAVEPADSVTEPSTPIHEWANRRLLNSNSPGATSVTEPESETDHDTTIVPEDHRTGPAFALLQAEKHVRVKTWTQSQDSTYPENQGMMDARPTDNSSQENRIPLTPVKTGCNSINLKHLGLQRGHTESAATGEDRENHDVIQSPRKRQRS